jgi:hypothetical protein
MWPGAASCGARNPRLYFTWKIDLGFDARCLGTGPVATGLISLISAHTALPLYRGPAVAVWDFTVRHTYATAGNYIVSRHQNIKAGEFENMGILLACCGLHVGAPGNHTWSISRLPFEILARIPKLIEPAFQIIRQ